METPTEYKGETRPRQTWVIYVLSWISPGLGLLYVGQWHRALLANLGFVVLLELFLILFAALKFFPALPFLVLLGVWATYASFMARAARRRVPTGDYVLKNFNHPLVYLIFATLTFLGPVLATMQFTEARLMTTARVDHAGMIPTIRPGDVVLIDRTVFKKRTPQRGELLTVEDNNNVLPLRAIAVEGDAIRFEGDVVFLNEEPLPRQAAQLGISDKDVVHVLESNQGTTYPLAFSPRVQNYAMTRLAQIPEDTIFAMADNRSLVPADGGPAQNRDSRAFGPIERTSLVGKPLFIAWSTDPTSGDIRWNRIGLRIQ